MEYDLKKLDQSTSNSAFKLQKTDNMKSWPSRAGPLCGTCKALLATCRAALHAAPHRPRSSLAMRETATTRDVTILEHLGRGAQGLWYCRWYGGGLQQNISLLKETRMLIYIDIGILFLPCDSVTSNLGAPRRLAKAHRGLLRASHSPRRPRHCLHNYDNVSSNVRR